MEYKEWERHNAPNGEHIWCGDVHIADLDGETANVDARLIVTAVNACIKLNPKNPMEIAEGISDMFYEALAKRAKQAIAAQIKNPKVRRAIVKVKREG